MTGGRRSYQALEVECPRCHAAAGEPCWSATRAERMRGVHRDRDLKFNRTEYEKHNQEVTHDHVH